MQFNEKYLSIPPYISTTWNNIRTLRMVGTALQVTLFDDTFVMVRDLEMDVIEDLFEAHVLYLSRQTGPGESTKDAKEESTVSEGKVTGTSITAENPGLVFPFHSGMGEKEMFGNALQHNLEYANAPDLPQDVITKIASIAKIVAPADSMEFPQPEPHCNCPYCQIARTINLALGNPVRPFSGSYSAEEDVHVEVVEPDEGDLKFQQWQIEQIGENLFTVTNKLDSSEHYSVFLGTPVGCTCGNKGCEHIITVLES